MMNFARVACLCVFAGVCLPDYTDAQTLSGKVTDSETGEPVQFANVFFANTMTGTTTDLDGNFKLTGFPEGKYDLVISFVGYTPFVQSIFVGAEEQHLEVKLIPDEIQLSDIEVTEDTAGWEHNYKVFRENFLGKTRNAEEVEILNPKTLHLYYDQDEAILYAHAKEPLQIVNDALGYKVSYILREFQIDYRKGRFLAFGIPQFTEMDPKNKGQQDKWEKQRLRAYHGSLMEFFRSLKSSTLSENGYEVHELYRVQNPQRPDSKVIDEKISMYRKLQKVGRVEMEAEIIKSLNQWIKYKNMPELVDSLGIRVESGDEIKPHYTNVVEYKGMLQVIYKKEREELGYRLLTHSSFRSKEQLSWISFLDDRLIIYDNGYYDDNKSVFLQKYWGYSSNLAELLPMEYLPPVAK